MIAIIEVPQGPEHRELTAFITCAFFFVFFWSSLCPFQVKHFVSTFWFVGLDLDLISENRGEGKFYKYELNINFLSFIKNNMRLH